MSARDGASSARVRELDVVRDIQWAASLLDRALAGRVQARRGELIDVLALPGLVAEIDGRPAGLLTYRLDADGCELAAIAVDATGGGIGGALVDALRARLPGIPIWAVTTNDNLDALRFYQRRGFRLRALRPGAVDESRTNLKPSIGEIGNDGIPIRDELELVLDPEARPQMTPAPRNSRICSGA